MSDPLIKALMLDERMRFDPYLRQHIYNSLNKKIKEAYEGSLYLPGNYQTMISDPYALAEHALGLEPKGLLKDKQHYSDYWNKHNINKVSFVFPNSPFNKIVWNNGKMETRSKNQNLVIEICLTTPLIGL